VNSCKACGQETKDLLVCPNCGDDLGSETGVVQFNALRPTPTPVPTEYASAGDLTESDELAVSELSGDCALLLVKRGPQAGSRFLLDSDAITVGRAGDNEIFLDDVSVSRKHAVFQRSTDSDGGAHFLVRDIGSLNGTYVNRDRIDSTELSSGDEVQIGKFRLVFYPGVVR